MVTDYALGFLRQSNIGKNMGTPEKQVSDIAINVASIIQTLLNQGIKTSEIKSVLNTVGDPSKLIKDSQMTKLKNPDKYPHIFSEDTLNNFHTELIKAFQKKIEMETTPFDSLKGWYQVFTLAYDGKILDHIVKIDLDSANQLRMFWDYDKNTKDFNSSGIISIRGPQLFTELLPTYVNSNKENIFGNRSRFLIVHTGLFDGKIANKRALSGMVTRLRSNNSEIIAYTCLFIKLEEMLIDKTNKINHKTPLERILSTLNNEKIENSIKSYAYTYFDNRLYRDKEKKHCLTVTPLDNYSLEDIQKGDIYLKERSENEKLAGLYMTICNLPPANTSEQFTQKKQFGFLFINRDSSIRLKTDNYNYKGNCIIYSGTNTLEIRAEAYLADDRLEDTHIKVAREFSILMTFSLGDNKSLDFSWISGVSVGVSQDNAPIALSEKLIRLDKYFLRDNKSESVFDEQLIYFNKIRKGFFKQIDGIKITKEVLRLYEIEGIDLMLDYIKSPRKFDTPVDKNSFTYQIYLDSFYGGIYKLQYLCELRNNSENLDWEVIDDEAQLVFNTLSSFHETFKHGFDYNLLSSRERSIFETTLNIIITNNTLPFKCLRHYFSDDNINRIKGTKSESNNISEIFKNFPLEKDNCKIKIIEIAFGKE